MHSACDWRNQSQQIVACRQSVACYILLMYNQIIDSVLIIFFIGLWKSIKNQLISKEKEESFGFSIIYFPSAV